MNTYRIAGIDVHKKMLAVVVTDVAVSGEYVFERRKFGTTISALEELAEWLRKCDVREVVMESTAQYWKPVWHQLETGFLLHLAQAQSNKAPGGRKRDFTDAERLVRRFVAGELVLSLVPGAEQRRWRTLTHTRVQLTRDKARLMNQMEQFLESNRIKLSSFVSTLRTASARRILDAVSEGSSDPHQLAALAKPGVKATSEQLAESLRATAEMDHCNRVILKLALERLDMVERQIAELERLLAEQLKPHSGSVQRLAGIPGFGAESAAEVIAEVGPAAERFRSAAHMASWAGVCPGRQESAGVSYSDRCPGGNRSLKRVLNQTANAAIKAKGCIFEQLYRRLVSRIGHRKAVAAVMHAQCRVAWKILHDPMPYEERGHRTNPHAVAKRASRLLAALKRLNYDVTAVAPPPPTPQPA